MRLTVIEITHILVAATDEPDKIKVWIRLELGGVDQILRQVALEDVAADGHAQLLLLHPLLELFHRPVPVLLTKLANNAVWNRLFPLFKPTSLVTNQVVFGANGRLIR
uniref:Uncharacterized protein n=1 Tax=Favella ehrenbergii TaxID=182087 RepID=A0A7S3MN38_9SPIT